MSRTAKKLIAVNGRRMRVTRLDSCGRLVYGDNNVSISNGFASVQQKTNTTSQDAILIKNANAEILLNVPEVVSFASYTLTMEFQEVDPELFSMITGMRVIYDANGNPVGYAANSRVIAANVAFALEVWAGAPTAVCTTGSNGNFGYSLFPFCTGGVVDGVEFSAGAISFSVESVVTKDGNAWGTGPYNVVMDTTGAIPSQLPAALDPYDHDYLVVTQVAPPAATTGSRPQLNPTATALTSLALTNTGRVVTTAGTPAVAAGVGTWIDWGDGTWDYVTTAGSAATHTYTAAGTFTVSASTNGTWVTKAITLT